MDRQVRVVLRLQGREGYWPVANRGFYGDTCEKKNGFKKQKTNVLDLYFEGDRKRYSKGNEKSDYVLDILILLSTTAYIRPPYTLARRTYKTVLPPPFLSRTYQPNSSYY